MFYSDEYKVHLNGIHIHIFVQAAPVKGSVYGYRGFTFLYRDKLKGLSPEEKQALEQQKKSRREEKKRAKEEREKKKLTAEEQKVKVCISLILRVSEILVHYSGLL